MPETKIVAHLTSLHPRWDARICRKQVNSSSEIYETFLIVSDGLGDNLKNSNYTYSIYDLGKRSRSILKRVCIENFKFYRLVKSLNVKIVHLHDPELLILGLIFKIFGYKVIYDVHEDYPVQIKSKNYIPLIIRSLVSMVVKGFESFCARYFDAVTVASEHIQNRFLKYTSNVYLLANYPISNQFKYPPTSDFRKEYRVLYVGTISDPRGIREVMKAIGLIDKNIIFDLAGPFNSEKYEEEIRSMPEWSKVNYHGIIDSCKYAELCEKASLGLVIDHPLENYKDAFATKMFEYMAAGLPILISNFEMWNAFLKAHPCGLCVDPLNHKEISESINWLLSNDEISKKMGAIGREIVVQQYSWESQAKNLKKMYEQL